METHTHPFNGPLSRTTRVSRNQKGKTNLDFTEARDSEWQWHQLGHMQVCTSLQTDNHASTPPLSFFTGWMPFLPLNQQCQSTEGNGDSEQQTEMVDKRDGGQQTEMINNKWIPGTMNKDGEQQMEMVNNKQRWWVQTRAT